jgi:hypothetical protein
MVFDAYGIGSRWRAVGGGRPYHWWRSLCDRRELNALRDVHAEPQRQFPRRVALLFIGTGRYVEFFASWHASLRELFLPATARTYFAFTDRGEEPALQAPDVRVVAAAHHPFPRVNLLKYQIINSVADELDAFSHVIYIDADMVAVSPVTESTFFCHDEPLFAVRHYNCLRRVPAGAFERRPISRAAVAAGDDLSTYWQACFWGGRAEPFLALSRELEARTADDLRHGVTAKWWDESFLNKYLVGHKDSVYTYPSTYAWPEGKPVPRGCSIMFEHKVANPVTSAGTPSIRGSVRRRKAGAHQLR